MTGPASPTLQRLDDQIDWYSKRSQSAQTWFKGLKIVQLVTAGIIPLLGIFNIPLRDKMTAVPGLVTLIAQGLQQLYQFHANWLSYRSTAEALKHEKFLYLAGAGPYAKVDNALPLLAERSEALILQEHLKWLTGQQQRAKDDESSKQGG
jgi:hypothetical protein